MIKLFALFFMLFDHVGKGLIKPFFLKNFLFEYNLQLRGIYAITNLIGRLSMPMFAYCIARGFDHYVKNGNIKKYFRNLAIFSVVSQVPYSLVYCHSNETIFRKSLFFNFSFLNLNIGVTWLLAITLLFLINQIEKDFLSGKFNFLRIGSIVLVLSVIFIIPYDYDFFGVFQVVLFYFLCFRFKSSILLLISSITICVLFCSLKDINIFGGSNDEIFAIFAVFLVLYLQKFDYKLRLPKCLFYFFYPIHLALISALNMLFIK